MRECFSAGGAETPDLRPRGVGGESVRPVFSGGGGLGEAGGARLVTYAAHISVHCLSAYN